MSLRIKIFEFSPFQVNSYLLIDDDTKKAILIDAACYTPEEEQRLASYIDKEGLEIVHILATHLHLDHTFGSRFVTERFGLPMVANTNDNFLLNTTTEQAAAFGLKLPALPAPIGVEVKEGDSFQLGENRITTLHVPGHSPGSIVYYCADCRCAFVGDVLFRNSIGRTDLPQGDYQTLIQHITEKLLTLPSETVIYPGHGARTTIQHEMENNPYLG